MKQPRVNTRSVADTYASDGERIIEFSHEFGGGLISLLPADDKRLVISLYRLDPTVDIQFRYDGERPGGGNRPVDPDEPATLTWTHDESNGPDRYADQYADSALTAPTFGIRSAFWHLSALAPDAWVVTLRAQDGDDVEISDAGKTMGNDFPTEQAAKDAAQRYEQANR